MKILVTGALGMLGHDVVSEFGMHSHTIVATDTRSNSSAAVLDITNPLSIQAVLLREKPDWLINCAAFTQVDACEEKEDQATHINATGPGYLAEHCKKQGVRLLHISTDYVFDGSKEGAYREDDDVCPISAYGRSKLKGEQAIQANMDDYLIVRTQWLFGLHGPNFVATMIKLAQERDSLQVVNDQFGSPTATADLAMALRLLVEHDAKGIFHVCNRGSASWYDFAKKIMELSALNTPVNPVSTAEFPRPAKRPANSILSTNKFTGVTGKLMPPWQNALDEYLRNYFALRV